MVRRRNFEETAAQVSQTVANLQDPGEQRTDNPVAYGGFQEATNSPLLAPVLSEDIVWKPSDPFDPGRVSLTRTMADTQAPKTLRALDGFQTHMATFAANNGFTYSPKLGDLSAIFFYTSWTTENLLPEAQILGRTAQEIYEQDLLAKAGSSQENTTTVFDLSRVMTLRSGNKAGKFIVSISFDGQDGRQVASKVGAINLRALEDPSIALGHLQNIDPQNAAFPGATTRKIQASLRQPEGRRLLNSTHNTRIILGRLTLGYRPTRG